MLKLVFQRLSILSTRRSIFRPSVALFKRPFSSSQNVKADESSQRVKTVDSSQNVKTMESSPEKRLLIGFTCARCNHRSHHTISHQAYHHGLVMIECEGCRVRHLIADNLGWFKDAREDGSVGWKKIEELAERRGDLQRSIDGRKNE